MSVSVLMDIRRVEGLGISFCFRVSIRVSIGGDGNRERGAGGVVGWRVEAVLAGLRSS